jgi:bile acid:Na+ symporter, BASS family
MRETLLHLLKISVSVAIPLASLATGLRAATVDPLWLFRRPSLLLRSLLAILVIVPLGTILFLEAIGASGVLASGMIVAILAVGIGPPAALKQSKTAGDTLAYEVELNAVLLALAIVFIPAAVALIGTQYHLALDLRASSVAALVLTRALIPLLIGVLLARFLPRVAAPVGRMAGPFIQIVLLVVVVVALAATWRALFSLGGRAWLTCAAVALGALVVGHLFGGPERAERRMLATFSSMRFPGLALLIATILPLGKQVIPVVLAYAICSTVLVAVYGAVMSRRGHPAGRAAPLAPAPGRA